MRRSRPLATEERAAAAPLREELFIEAAGYASPLAGDVVEGPLTEDRARVLVRWRTPDGNLHEERLALVKGLHVQKGDLVLLHRPANWPEWLVTHVIEGGREPEGGAEKQENAHTGLHAESTAARPESPVRITADGTKVTVSAEEEISFRCGDAAIRLTRNGKVLISGVYILSRAKGTHRIKGGSVQIN